MNEHYKIIHYCENSKDIFEDWLKRLKDKRAAVAIARRVKRLEGGYFGAHKPCRSGVWVIMHDS